jgi:prefoldin subunit 5
VRFLKDQAEMLRGEIDAIDARLKELEKEKTQGGET